MIIFLWFYQGLGRPQPKHRNSAAKIRRNIENATVFAAENSAEEAVGTLSKTLFTSLTSMIFEQNGLLISFPDPWNIPQVPHQYWKDFHS